MSLHPSLLALLKQRKSTPARLLQDPAPDDATLAILVETALRVPDHGKLEPWRVLAFRGQPRRDFGTWLMQRRLQLPPAPTEAMLEKDRLKFTSAPVVLVVIARIESTERIPEQEQLLSGGCVCFSLLLAAEALGLGAQWLTGWPAYDAGVRGHLGLSAHERILGFIHLGQRAAEPPERLRPRLDQRYALWGD